MSRGRCVWKYQITVAEEPTVVAMPEGARILHVERLEPQVVTFWAEVETSYRDYVEYENRMFMVYGTGHWVEGEHVGTCVDGPFIWHLYEVSNER